MDALILVGGFGTRIRHLTGDIPKPLVTICGKPFLHWVLFNLKKYQLRNIFFLAHYGYTHIKEFAELYAKNGYNTECCRELSPAGTGGGVLDFLDKNPDFKNPFLLLNGDSILLDYDFMTARKEMEKGCDGVIFGVLVDDCSRYGTLVHDDKMILKSFNEKCPGSGLINSGVYMFSPKSLRLIQNENRPLSLENDLIPEMLNKKMRIKVICERGPFIDIGTEESFLQAELFITNNLS